MFTRILFMLSGLTVHQCTSSGVYTQDKCAISSNLGSSIRPVFHQGEESRPCALALNLQAAGGASHGERGPHAWRGQNGQSNYPCPVACSKVGPPRRLPHRWQESLLHIWPFESGDVRKSPVDAVESND